MELITSAGAFDAYQYQLQLANTNQIKATTLYKTNLRIESSVLQRVPTLMHKERYVIKFYSIYQNHTQN